MAGTPKITKIEIVGFSWDVKGMAFVLHKASYDPDSTATRYGRWHQNLRRQRRGW